MAADSTALTPLAITGYHGSPTAASLLIRGLTLASASVGGGRAA